MQADTLERPRAKAAVSGKSPRQRKRYDIDKLASQITDENRHGEVQVGPAVGQEFAG